ENRRLPDAASFSAGEDPERVHGIEDKPGEADVRQPTGEREEWVTRSPPQEPSVRAGIDGPVARDADQVAVLVGTGVRPVETAVEALEEAAERREEDMLGVRGVDGEAPAEITRNVEWRRQQGERRAAVGALGDRPGVDADVHGVLV